MNRLVLSYWAHILANIQWHLSFNIPNKIIDIILLWTFLCFSCHFRYNYRVFRPLLAFLFIYIYIYIYILVLIRNWNCLYMSVRTTTYMKLVMFAKKKWRRGQYRRLGCRWSHDIFRPISAVFAMAASQFVYKSASVTVSISCQTSIHNTTGRSHTHQRACFTYSIKFMFVPMCVFMSMYLCMRACVWVGVFVACKIRDHCKSNRLCRQESLKGLQIEFILNRHTDTQTHIHTYICTYTNTHAHTHIRMQYARTHTHTHSHTDTYTDTHAYMHVLTHAHTHT